MTSKRAIWSAAMVVAGLMVGQAIAADAETPAKDAPARDSSPKESPTTAPAKAEKSHAISGSGTVASYNYTAHGAIESLMIHTDSGMVQLNIPPESVDVTRNFAIDETVKFEARPEGKAHTDHPVYNLVSVTNAKGDVLRDNKVDSDKQSAHVEGAVKALNYSHGGDVNGVVLDTGDFIHLTPEGARQISLKVGDKVSADGRSTTMASGKQAIEASTVNGESIKHAPKPAGPKPPPPPRPHGDTGAPSKESGDTRHPEAAH